MKMPMKIPLLALPPNRVRRNYRGGATLDSLSGAATITDGPQPEDWIASTTRAVNPGLPPEPNEGISRVAIPGKGQILLTDLFAEAPEYYFGASHVARIGAQPGFLVKLLDSSIRLHVQAHPTATFAREHLNSPWGKLETYVILGARPGITPYIRLGFQRPPSPAEWRRIILEQDITVMDACFDRIPVHPGEVWLVPGGLPHAIGEGVLMLEVMEPTDLVVRCEFEREGIVVPPQARFMQRDPDFALRIFDYSPLPVDKVREHCRITPRLMDSGPGLTRDLLIGPEQSPCFSIFRLNVTGTADFSPDGRLGIAVVASGAGDVIAGTHRLAVRQGSTFLVAASSPMVQITSVGPEPLHVLLSTPN
jgi:mannose-6-phosphate isomerase